MLTLNCGCSYSIMTDCWAEAPEDRPDITDLLERLQGFLDMQMVR